MRRFLWVLLIAVLAFGAAACGDDDGDEGAASTPSTSAAADLGLITPGTLTVASDIPYQPFEFFDPGSTEAKGFDVDRRKILLPDAIKALGEFQVPVKLHRDVTAQLKVTVSKE